MRIRLPRIIPREDYFRRRAGGVIDREDFLKGLEERRRLDWQSKDIAAKLKEAGHPMEYEDRSLAIVSVCGNYVEWPKFYKNSNLIPSNQSRNTSRMLTDLTFYVEKNKGRGNLRMCVGKGTYSQLGNIRDSHQALRRAISKFNAHPFLKENGIQIQFANVEYTVQIKPHNWRESPHHYTRFASTSPWFNLHSHMLIKCDRHLGKDLWKRFLELGRAHMPGGYFHDAGKLQKAAECCKYMFKPDEVLKLKPVDLGMLYMQTKGLKYFQPMGEFKEMRRDLRLNGHVLKKFRKPDGRTVWNRVQYAAPIPDDFKPEPESPEEALTRLLMREEDPGERAESVKAAGKVLAFMPPAPRFSPRMEGAMLVKDYKGDFAALVQQNDVGGKVASIQKMAENPDPSIWDTTTTTVREPEPDIYVDYPELHDPPPMTWQEEIAAADAAQFQALN